MNVFQFTIVFTAIAETIGQAGVELEALTAVQAAFLIQRNFFVF
jgi:molybdenum cofactor biosynthesis enzyme